MTELPPLPSDLLPAGVRSRFIDGVNGLRVHILEAGHDEAGRPLALLLHGFPELAYSWRRMLRPLADAGFHVVAPDQRGYGRTTGWSAAYDQPLRPFAMLSLVRDAFALVRALGHDKAAAVIGHDFGSPVAAWCGIVRPDVFRAVVMMSAPFAGPPPLELGTPPHPAADPTIEALARLDRPRKHYQWYYATRPANDDMWRCPEGVHAFLRAYFHHKSADWPENRPFRLAGWTADELARMPTYYIMDRDRTMAETVRPERPSPEAVAACEWLTEREMAVYSSEYGRTGFQGGLNWYRTRFEPELVAEHALFADRTIDVPSMFIAGEADWGIYQFPGALERMRDVVCTRMTGGCHLIPGAGHWVMQERPEPVARLLVDFCRAL